MGYINTFCKGISANDCRLRYNITKRRKDVLIHE